jgi:hypothetical protein
MPRQVADESVLRNEYTRLALCLESDDYAGWDPFDALNSPILSHVARLSLQRRLAIQVLKRSPVNLRPVFRLRRSQNAKTLALATIAYRRAGDTENAARAAERLIDLRSPGADAWGYGFDVETRWGGYRAGTPNAVVTSFACRALAGLEGFEDELDRARGFALEHLLARRPGAPFFAYYPRAEALVHNANLLMSAAFSNLPPGAERSAAHAAAATTVAAQESDGSWPYGAGPNLGWVDGYHTLYNLDAIAAWVSHDGTGEFDAALARGLDFYVTRMVDPDGAPRASAAARYPIDIHACSTAVAVLTQLADHHPRATQVAAQVLGWTLANMKRRDGRFAFQRHRLFRNSISYIRWNDAHMLLALATCLEAAGR